LAGDSKLEALDASLRYDVCVIGSGVAGTTLATTLARRGVRTLLLEAGRGLLSWLTDRRLKELARFEYTGDTNYPLVRAASRVLGGNSNFWAGRSERLHPSDFATHPYTPPDNPWPIGYADLERYYEAAEQLLRVRGGPRSRGGPPRRAPLPLPGKPDITYLKKLCARLDIDVEDSATATPQRGLHFFRMSNEILPEFRKSPSGTLVTGATVTRLVAAPAQRIAEAEVKTLDGGVGKARAGIFVVCCGGVEAPRLLRLSASEEFPNGIGNAGDLVGRGFNDHPSLGFYASIPHSWGTLVPTNKIARTHQFYQAFRPEGLGSMIPVFRQAWLLPNHILPFALANIPRNTLSTLGRVARAAFFIGAGIEMKIDLANRIALSSTQKDIFGRPLPHLIFNYSPEDLELIRRTRELIRSWLSQLGATRVREAPVAFPRHFIGACRMGDDARTSVVDRNLQVHDTRNLYVCGSETFVTGGAMGPTLTIAALALRLADHLVDRLQHS